MRSARSSHRRSMKPAMAMSPSMLTLLIRPVRGIISELTDFRSENYQLEDIPTIMLDLDTSNGEFAGRNSYSDMVDGALYGDSKDLQAGGSFSVSRSTTSASEVSISGSFAAEATSISK